MMPLEDISVSRFPTRLLTLTAIVTGVVLVWLGWGAYHSYRVAQTATHRDLKIERLRGMIVHLDEVLTMSARMAVATGDRHWEDRYRRHDPQLHAAIKEAMALSPEAAVNEAAAQTDAADIKLEKMENHAFALVRQGRLEDARAVLFSGEYETQKQVYAEGMKQLADLLDKTSEAALRTVQKTAFLSGACAVVAISALLLAWLVVLRTVRHWRAEVYRTRQELEIRVQRRTKELTREIMDRQRAEEVIKRESAKLLAMISGMDEGVVFADGDNTIVEINDYFCRFVGMPREQIVGKRLEQLHRGAPVERILRLIEGFRQEACAAPLVLQRPLGDKEVILRVQPIYHDGKYDGVLMNVIDVSELVRARQKAEDASKAKSAFLANVSHEIRTPMTAILGYADLLADPSLSAGTRGDYLAVVRRNGEHLLNLINDVLDLSKIEAGKLALEMRQCSLVSLLADVVSMMRPRAQQRGNSLCVEYAGELPETIHTDSARLRQAMGNLVGNAVKFTENGTVRIRVCCLGDWRNGQAAVKIQVIDTGIGIREEVLPRLFQPFSQGDASVSRKFGGTGLGLAISHHVVQLLGGELTVESTFGQGSTFTLTIPVGDLRGVRMLQCPAEAVEEPACGPCLSSGTELSGVRILLAEDGFDNQQLIRTVLQQAGATVEIAENGRIALGKAEQEPFDLVLMDMNMPEIDGYQATEILRGRGYQRPILALTANGMSGDSQRCLAAGCNEHLVKPIDRARLIRTIAGYVGKVPAGDDQARHFQEDQAPPPADHAEADANGAISSQFADDPQMAAILGEFVARLAGHVSAMQEALADHCYEGLQQAAHQMKGSGGSYGYPALSDAAKALEEATKQRDGPAAVAALEHVATLCKAIEKGRGQPACTGESTQ